MANACGPEPTPLPTGFVVAVNVPSLSFKRVVTVPSEIVGHSQVGIAVAVEVAGADGFGVAADTNGWRLQSKAAASIS